MLFYWTDWSWLLLNFFKIIQRAQLDCDNDKWKKRYSTKRHIYWTIFCVQCYFFCFPRMCEKCHNLSLANNDYSFQPHGFFFHFISDSSSFSLPFLFVFDRNWKCTVLGLVACCLRFGCVIFLNIIRARKIKTCSHWNFRIFCVVFWKDTERKKSLFIARQTQTRYTYSFTQLNKYFLNKKTQHEYWMSYICIDNELNCHILMNGLVEVLAYARCESPLQIGAISRKLHPEVLIRDTSVKERKKINTKSEMSTKVSPDINSRFCDYKVKREKNKFARKKRQT